MLSDWSLRERPDQGWRHRVIWLSMPVSGLSTCAVFFLRSSSAEYFAVDLSLNRSFPCREDGVIGWKTEREHFGARLKVVKFDLA